MEVNTATAPSKQAEEVLSPKEKIANEIKRIETNPLFPQAHVRHRDLFDKRRERFSRPSNIL